MSERRKLRLADAVSVKHGFAFKGDYFSGPGPGPVLVTPGNFAPGGGWRAAPAKYYLGPEAPDYRLEPGDLVVTMTDLSKSGDTLGYSAVVPPGGPFLHNQRIGLVKVLDEGILDEGFLGYLLQGDAYRRHVLASATGSTVRHTSPGRILGYECLVPSLGEQRAIAEILGALDDKIEANRRVAMAGEALVRAAVAEAQESAEHVVPLGSLVERVSEVVQPAALPPGTRYVGLEHMPRGSLILENCGTTEDLASAKAAFRPRDILFGKLRPYFKKVALAASGGVCSTDILVLRPRSGDWAVAAAIAASDEVVDYATSGSEGTRMPRTSWDYLSRCSVRTPVADEHDRLQAFLGPILEVAVRRAEETSALALLRRVLLPNLLTGEVRVKEAENLVGEAM